MRCQVMGILNVTTDSFSDGGNWLDIDRAVAHAKAMMEQGADLIDVGGESTRPGAVRVTAELERSRVIPVIRALSHAGIPTSVDTMRASVAAAAVEAFVYIEVRICLICFLQKRECAGRPPGNRPDRPPVPCGCGLRRGCGLAPREPESCPAAR